MNQNNQHHYTSSMTLRKDPLAIKIKSDVGKRIKLEYIASNSINTHVYLIFLSISHFISSYITFTLLSFVFISHLGCLHPLSFYPTFYKVAQLSHWRYLFMSQSSITNKLNLTENQNST